MTDLEQVDVVVLGGGLAGLTLALQLRGELPEASIIVLERGKPPFPDAAFKIGESTVEIGGQYLVRLLGEDYLETHHIRKSGPRFYFTGDENADITNRLEYGTSDFLPIHSYQIDRGRLENELWARVSASGADLRPGSKVLDIEIEGDGPHRVTYESDDGQTLTIQARWVVDGSGRAGLLKRKLGLEAASMHKAGAAWWRMQTRTDLDTWSCSQSWRSAAPTDHRYKATTHLMGDGYWVWIIPLPTGGTSFGIVAHPDYHSFNEYRTFDRALAWLRKHEPQCAREVEAKRDKLLDFAGVRHYSYSATRVFSKDRWALTGEAGVFLDPFLSPGTDYIAIGNTMITNMIAMDLRGEDHAQYVEFANGLYLQLYDLMLPWFDALYTTLGRKQAMVLWVAWYFAIYMSVPVTLFLHDRLAKAEFMGTMQEEIGRFAQLATRGVHLLKEFGARYNEPHVAQFVNISKLEHIIAIQRELINKRELDDQGVRELVKRNLGMLEAMLVEYFERITKKLELDPGVDKVNPYAVSLDAERWPEDGLEHSADLRRDDVRENIDAIWYSS